MGLSFHNCGAVLTLVVTIFDPGVSELCMYGRISHREMVTCPHQGVLALCTISSQLAKGQLRWDFHTVLGGFLSRRSPFMYLGSRSGKGIE